MKSNIMGDNMANQTRQKGKKTSSPKSKNEKEPLDTIIWVGGCYPKILCEKQSTSDMEFSYPPHGKRPRNCYVHEAEVRGCCRKVSAVADWMVPGKSRIFLAHRDKRGVGCGSLFGYYVLDRIEVIPPYETSSDEHILDNPVHTITKNPVECMSVSCALSQLEPYRSCGMRPKKDSERDSIYLVDALASDIVDTFSDYLKTKKYPTREQCFEKAVEDAGKRHLNPSTTPHKSIKGNAKVCGELVLFDKKNREYPPIRRGSQAAFRGLLKVNGEKLIDGVSEWFAGNMDFVPIPYYDMGKKWSNPATFAYNYGLNKACAEGVLTGHPTELSTMRTTQGYSVTVPGVGKFTNKAGKIHFKPKWPCEPCPFLNHCSPTVIWP